MHISTLCVIYVGLEADVGIYNDRTEVKARYVQLLYTSSYIPDGINLFPSILPSPLSLPLFPLFSLSSLSTLHCPSIVTIAFPPSTFSFSLPCTCPPFHWPHQHGRCYRHRQRPGQLSPQGNPATSQSNSACLSFKWGQIWITWLPIWYPIWEHMSHIKFPRFQCYPLSLPTALPYVMTHCFSMVGLLWSALQISFITITSPVLGLRLYTM